MSVLTWKLHSRRKWNSSQWNPHACTHMHQQLKFKTTRLHAAHRVFALCSSSANTNVKAYAKGPTMLHCRFTLCSLFYTIVPKESNSASDTHYQTCRSTAGYSSGLEHWSCLNDNHQLWNIFSPVHTPFLNALVGGRLHYIHLQIAARQLQGLCVKEKRFKCKSTQASGTPWGREIESCPT